MRQARFAAAVSVLILVGCSGQVTLLFKGDEKVNPREVSPGVTENIPVVVRAFMLKDKSAFMSASVEQLWTKEKYKAILGSDLVGEEREITVNAQGKNDEPKPLPLGELAADVRFIGVMALLKKSDPPQMRHTAVPKEEAASKVFWIVENRLEVK